MQNIDPNQEKKEPPSLREVQKMTARDFIQRKKQQMKVEKQNEKEMDMLTQYLEEGKVDKFKEELKTKGNQFVISFLLKQNNVRGGNLISMINHDKCNELLQAVSDWSKDNIVFLNETITGKMKSNELTMIDWRTKFMNFNREVFKKICLDIKSKEEISLNRQQLPQILSAENSLFSLLYSEFLSVQFIKLVIPSHQQILVFNNFLLPLVKQLLKKTNFKAANSIYKYYNSLTKQQIWTVKDFQNSLNHKELLVLNQLQFNFMHQLATNGKFKQIIQIYQIITENPQGRSSFKQLQLECLNQFNCSNQTSIDILLGNQTYANIKQILKFIQKNQYVYLSKNCLNKVLSNKNLKQLEVEELIIQFLDNSTFSNRGYIQRTYTKTQLNRKQMFEIKNNNKSFIILFNKAQIITSLSSSNSFPLLTYLNRFSKNPKLDMILKLFPEILQRKKIKQKLTSMISISNGEIMKIDQKTVGSQQVDNIMNYFEPIIKLICRYQNKDVVEMLIHRTFINCFFLRQLKQKSDSFRFIDWFGHHFIYEYIRNSPSLQNNPLNSGIFKKIFVESKETEKVKGKFNLYLELLKSLKFNQKIFQTEQWFPNEVKKQIKQYLLKYPSSQLAKIQFTYHLSLKTQLQKRQKKPQIHQTHYAFELMLYLFSNQELAHKFQQLAQIDLTIFINQNLVVQAVKAIVTNDQRHLEQLKQIVHKKEKKSQLNITSLYTLTQQYKNDRSFENLANLLKIYQKKKVIFKKPNNEAPEYLTLYKQYSQNYSSQKTLIFFSNEKDLQKKIMITLQNGIDIKIKQPQTFKPSLPNISNSIYKTTIDLITNNSLLSFIETLIRLPNQNLKNFQDMLKQLPKQFYFNVQDTLLTGKSSKETLRFGNQIHRPINFNFFLTLASITKIHFWNHFQRSIELYLKDLKYRLEDYNLFLLSEKQFKVQNNKIMKASKQKQINELAIEGYKYFKSQFKDLSQKNTQQKEKQETFYAQLFDIFQRNKKIFNLGQIFKTISLDQIMIKYRFSIFVIKIESAPTTALKLISDLFDKYSIDPVKSITEAAKEDKKKQRRSIFKKQKTHYYDFLKVISIQPCKEYVEIIKRFSDNMEFNFQLLSHVKDQNNIVEHMIFLEGKTSYIQTIISRQFSDSQIYLLSFLAILVEKLTNIFYSISEKDSLKKKKQNSKSSLFWKCSNQNFQQIMKAWRRYNQIEVITNQTKIDRGARIINSLFENQMWSRIARIFSQNLLQPQLVQATLSAISSCPQRIPNYKQNKQFKELISQMFNYLASNPPKNIDNIFKCVYIIDYKKAFELLKPQQLNLQTVLKCLKNNAQGSSMFLNVKISHKVQEDYRKQFPIHPYYIHDLDSKQWLVDLVILQTKILKIINNEKATARSLIRKKTVFLHPKIMKRYKQVYDDSQIQKNSKMILRNSKLQTFQGIPQPILKQCFNSISKSLNLSILHPKLVQQLILKKIIDKDNFPKIIMCCNIGLISIAMKAWNLKFDGALIKNIQEKQRQTFFRFLLKLNNQKFIIEFLTYFQIFQNYTEDIEHYSKSLLQEICGRRRVLVLQHCLKYWSSTFNRTLKFISGEFGKITRQGLITLPTFLAAENNFYQYYFLVKSSGNLSYAFAPSSRFLLQAHHNYEFIPEMSYRLKILKALILSIQNGSSLGLYFYILQTVFSLQPSIKADKAFLPASWMQSLPKFISYVAEGDMHLTEHIGIFQKLTYLVSDSSVGIPLDTLKKLYPNQMKIIQSVYPLSSKKAVQIPLDIVLKEDENLKASLLKNSPNIFMKYFEKELTIKSNHIYLYLEGIQYNIQLFEENYPIVLQKFIKQSLGCFTKQEIYQQAEEPIEVEVLNAEGSLYIYRHSFVLCLVSLSRGNGKAIEMFKKIKGWSTLNNFEVIKIIAQELNKLMFDISIWVKTYNILKQMGKPSKKINEQMLNNIINELQKELTKINVKGLSEKYLSLIRVQKEQQNIDSLYLGILMTLIKVKKDLKDLEEFFFSLNIPNFKTLEIQIVQKNVKVQFEQIGQKILFKTHYAYMKCHQILYAEIQCEEFKQKAKHKYFLNKVSEQIVRLNNFCADVSRQALLKELKFKFDLETFKRIQNLESLTTITSDYYSIQIIIRQLEKYEEQTTPTRQQGLYSLSDVYGPINFNDPNSQNILMDCMAFYQILVLPNRPNPIIVTYADKLPSPEQQDQLCLRDFKQYLQYFKEQSIGQHHKEYNFNNKISLSIDNSDNKKISVHFHEWSLFNIGKIISTVNRYSNTLKNKYDNLVDVRLSVVSVVQMYQQIRSKNSDVRMVGQISKFLNGNRHQELLQNVLFMIIEDAVNIMKTLRGLVFKYKILKQKQKDKQLFCLGETYSAGSLQYEIHDQILMIIIGVVIHKAGSVPEVKIEECPGLVSRKYFLDSIFSSAQFLTDYFFNKQQINQECVKVSSKISNDFKTQINVTVNFKSLYEFIQKHKEVANIKDIDGYLNILKNYLLIALEPSISQFIVSQDVIIRHQVKLLNKFEAMGKGISIDKIDESHQIIYTTQKTQQLGLKRAKGLESIDKKDQIKNIFLIQIYKSQFSSMVTEGMSFILGYKNRQPILKKLSTRHDINQVDVVELAYLLWITPTLPTEDELRKSKIIRLFISDLSSNIYKIDEATSELLLKQSNEDRNIADLAPMVAPNMIISFPSIHNKTQKTDSSLNKVFQIPLTESPKFKLNPKVVKPVSLTNQIKTDSQSQNAIQNLVSFFKKSFNFNINLIFSAPPELQMHLTNSQLIKLTVYEIQYCFDSLINPPPYSNQLQKRLSIFNGQNALTNYFVTQRQILIQEISNQIRIQFNNQSAGVNIKNGIIVIQIKLIKGESILSGDQMATTILRYLINKIKLPNYVKLGEYENMTKQTMCKVLDSLLQIEHQTKQILLAFNIYKILNPKISLNYLMQISLQARQQLRINDNLLEFGFRIDREERQFYSASNILSFLITKNLGETMHNTSYNPITKLIQIRNLRLPKVDVIFIDSQQKITLQNHNLDIKDGLSVINPPPKTRQYFIIQKDNVSSNYIYDYPIKDILSVSKNNQLIINQTIYFNLLSQKKIDLNTLSITLFAKKPNSTEKQLSMNIIEQNKFKGVNLYFLSHEAVQISIQMPYSCTGTLNYPGFINKKYDGQNSHFTVVSNGDLALQNTLFIQLYFRNKLIAAKKDNKKYQMEDDDIFKEPLEKKIGYEFLPVAKKDAQFMVYVVNDQSRKYLTRAGEQRIDYIQLCDADANPIDPPAVQIYFEHVNRLALIKPTITKKNGVLALKWTPIVRGHYLVYINNICVNPQYQIGVCASYADANLSKAEKPKVTSLCYAQETECMFELMDCYGNIYTELEQAVIGDALMFEVISSVSQQTIVMKLSPIDKYGTKKVRFSIGSSKVDVKQTAQISVLMNRQKMLSFVLDIKGQALKQRRKRLQKDIEGIKKNYYKDIKVNRCRFLQQLFRVAEKNLHVIFSVTFSNQQGYDAGGLKRQFYDMVGKQFKSQRNSFFKPIDDRKIQYFIDNEILKNKKKKQYMELLGKYLANAILNNYLLGISFSPVFIKLLYEDQITFDDLLTIVPIEQAQRYKYLLKASEEEIDDLELYFSVVVDKKKETDIELIPGGREIKVTKDRMGEYTERLSKCLLSERFKDIIESFREGFNSVMALDLVRRWIRPEQFWALTAGTKQVTAQVVLNYIVFSRGSDIHSGWCRRYISEANQEVLVGFLKFSSGSSSIDFDQTSKITVTFENSGDNPKKLPISHTCWKEIVIPKYKTYEIMKKMLDAAFLFCSQGFGFG